MMKNILLGAVGLAAAGIAAPAVAADLPAVPTRSYTKAPAYVASIYDWSGFYLGANAGYGTERSCWDFTNAGAFVAAEGCHNAGGAIAGGQLGLFASENPVLDRRRPRFDLAFIPLPRHVFNPVAKRLGRHSKFHRQPACAVPSDRCRANRYTKKTGTGWETRP